MAIRGGGARGRRLRRGAPAAWAVVLIATALRPAAATAQRIYAPEEERWLNAGWKEDVAFAAANGLLSGVVSGLLAKLAHDRSFAEGFRGGATGGVVTYAGKRLAAERFWGAGLLGRQVASLGGSLAWNAREGRGAFDRLIVQLAVARLYWDRTEARLTVRPDLLTLYYTALAVAESRVQLDWSMTFSAGAPMFVTTSDGALDDNAAGRAFAGLALLDANATLALPEIATHERIHIIQYDQHFALWGEAAERGFASLLGNRPARLLGRADLGIALMPFAPFADALARGVNPLEIEADFLTVR
jgi:hypothetical protein